MHKRHQIRSLADLDSIAKKQLKKVEKLLANFHVSDVESQPASLMKHMKNVIKDRLIVCKTGIDQTLKVP